MDLRTMFDYSNDNDIAILLAYRGQIAVSKAYVEQDIPSNNVLDILSASSKIFENNRVGLEASNEGFKNLGFNFSKEDFLNGLNNFLKIIDEKINGIISHKEQSKNISPLDKNHIQIAMSNIKSDLENNKIDLVEASKRMDLIGAGIHKHVENKSLRIQERLMDPYRDAFMPFMEILARGSTFQARESCLRALEKNIKQLSRLKNV